MTNRYNQTNQQCDAGQTALSLTAAAGQRRRVALSESISTAQLNFMEYGSITRMAAVMIEGCLVASGASCGLLIESRPQSRPILQAIALSRTRDTGTISSELPDILYEIRRNGSVELGEHDCPLLRPLTSGSITSWEAGNADCSRCTCPLNVLNGHNVIAIPLSLGPTVIGALYLADCAADHLEICLHDLISHAQTCALALAGARADLERKHAHDQLRQAQKMEAIGQLAGGIAHDFNNLLTVINGYTSLLLQKMDGNEEVCRDLQQVASAGDRAAALIRQLLSFSRRQIVNLQVVNINVLITGLHPFLTRLIGEHITLLTQLSPDLGAAYVDPGLMEQIVMNLVINARDAIQSGGSITVMTENRAIDQLFASRNPGAIPGEYVVISVTDSGVGIPPEMICRIFEPFFTTKPQGVGTGLGLATVYGIVKQSNGYIRVVSEVGIGSEFRVYIPRIRQGGQAELADERPHSAQHDPLNGSGLLLVVEDDRTVLDLAAITLRGRGFDVITASSPREALAIFEQHADSIDLLLSDVIMPEMSGDEMAALMLVQRPDLKIVFMSGYSDDHLKNSRINGVSYDFIMKPLNSVELVRVIRDRIESSPQTECSQ